MTGEEYSNRSIIALWIGITVLVLLLYFNLVTGDSRHPKAIALVETTPAASLLPTITPAPTADPSASTAISSAIPANELALIKQLFVPLPSSVAPEEYTPNEAMVNLGRMLFYDTRLSKTGSISCNTCHLLDRYGVDGEVTSFSIDGGRLTRNSPTVYNAVLQIAQFWDGRATTLEDQSRGPLFAADEMGMSDPTFVENILRSIPDYAPLFAAAYPDQPEPVSVANLMRALGAFERGLLTPSRFDQFLTGDLNALTSSEQAGLRAFVKTGCATCHVGAALGGRFFRKLGHMTPYETTDLGRFKVTQQEEDRHVFKVAILRNIAQTAPYLHDGSITTLEAMVQLMARHQLGKELSSAEVTSIVTFLGSLTGDLPVAYIAPPALPADGPETAALLRIE